MRIFVILFVCLLLVGCGSMQQPYTPRGTDNYSVGVQILERNKVDIKKIKDRTADDLELGHRVRTLRAEYPNDRIFVQKVNEAMAEQESYREDAVEQVCNKLHISSPAIVLILLNILGIVYVIIKISGNARNRGAMTYAKRKEQNSESDS